MLILRCALLALWLAAGLVTSSAHGREAVPRLGDYQHTIWGAQQGAPAEVLTMTQTNDGWLWLGTLSGLFRFDGVHFLKYAPASGAQLLSDRISTLWAADNGDLWIGYLEGGMSVLHGDQLRHIANQGQDSPVSFAFGMAMDDDGSMWVITSQGLRHYTAGKWRSIGPESGLPGPRADAIFIDHNGRLWVSNDDHLYQLDRASGKFIDSGIAGSAGKLAESPDGRLWLGEKTAWRVLPAPATGSPPLPGNYRFHRGEIHAMFDRDGNHWQLLCPAGVCRTATDRLHGADRFDVASDATDHFNQLWQLGSLATYTMLEDREGNVWIGTQAGLERFRYQKLRAAAVPSGESFVHFATDTHGMVWASTMPNGYLFKVGGGAAPVLERPHTNPVIGTATDGSLLLADADRFERRRGGVNTAVALPAGIDGKANKDNYPVLVCGDADSAWVVLSRRGVYRLHDGSWTDARRYGIGWWGLRAVVAGPAGDAWFGYADGTILHVGRDALVDKRNAEVVGRITLLDVGSGLIVGGTRGLALWRDGRFHAIHAADAEAIKGISGLLVDAAGDRWLNGRKGVVHVRAADWAAMVRRPDLPLRYELFDAFDGYPGTAQVTVIGPSAIRGGDGRLWFVGTGGVVSIDPGRIRRNRLAPPVVLTGLHTDIGEGLHAAVGDYPVTSGQELPPGVSGVRIDYGALSYVMPERVRFDYKLDGVDARWLAAGTSREAYYRQLGPGTYRFHVRATNEEGIVSREEAELTFSIPPTFVQTAWFKLICAIAAAALLYAAYAWRLRALARYYDERARVRLAERERIARGLHDTLMQSIQGIVLRFHGISVGLPVQHEARRQMQTALDQADQAVQEGRRAITSLRATTAHGDDLNGAFAMLGAALQDTSGAQFKLLVQGEPARLDGVLSEEIYFIGREALANAFQHAKASVITLAICYGQRWFTLTVRDDGIGMDVAGPRQGQRDGHWGLPGMRERAQLIGAEFAIRSAADSGTEVSLRLAGSLVYRPARQSGWCARLVRRLRPPARRR